MKNKGLGEILVEQHVITEEKLQEAVKAAQAQDILLEDYLLTHKIITQVQLAQAYALYASFPFVQDITDAMADPMLLGKIPLKFLRDNVVIPVMIEGKIAILTSNSTMFQPLDQLNMVLGGNADYMVAPRSTIIEAINKYYPLEGSKQMLEELEQESKEDIEDIEFGAIEETDIVAMAAEAPIIKLVNHIFFKAVKRGASDIHIEPYEKELVVRYRIDGVLYKEMSPPKRLQGALISRIKIMANLNIAEKRVPQDGRIDLKIAGKPIDIRVSVLPVAFGERVVMRILDKSRSFGALKNLDFSKRDLTLIEKGIAEPNGIVYITGPTGSGKTSTLYSILSEINKPDVNIITVEDPVEYQMSGIGQVQVKEKIGMTFAAALRSILRQDPDIVMIGETRDQETAQISVQAALTGHLVLSTLHTNSAPATITRLIDMGVEPFLLASSINLIIAQRLVRRLCEFCKETYVPEVDVLESIGLDAEKAKNGVFYRPVGCSECNELGYKGRLALFEVMEITEGVVPLIMHRSDTSTIAKQAIKDGMTTLFQDGVAKILSGKTTIEEVLSVAVSG